jgi:hypothetical protein
MSKVCVLSVLALVCASPVFAQGAANNPHLRLTQQYDWTFSEIGDVGNAPVILRDWFLPPRLPTPKGSVNYRYNISTTEVTWGQYYEFVQAHARTVPTNIRDGIVARNTLTPGAASPFNSPITYLGPGPKGEGTYTFDESFANRPATSTWHYFARMVNWLHNGKPDVDHAVASDFETGVYDTSTFARIPDGPKGVSYRTDQDTRSPGSRFWIPSMDELIKAGFYDPNKVGDGEGDWWRYGNSSDEAPIMGDPALGGQTNAGFERENDPGKWPVGQERPLDVGSYADQQSPWGLLDISGGGEEWTETWSAEQEFFHQSRLTLASRAYDPVELGDLLSGDLLWDTGSPPSTFISLRLAAAIPAPGASSLLAFGALLAALRRRI